MIITVFRSRLKPGAEKEYLEWLQRLSAIAKSMPGHISHKGFVADDGERLTLVEFESEEALRAWSEHPVHLDAKQKGRRDFYAEYRVAICMPLRTSRYVATHGPDSLPA